MKALELTVYPKLERPISGHQIMGYQQQRKAELALIAAKRFTDTELAAEYHYAAHALDMDWAQTGIDDPTLGGILDVLTRFATLPHYDEDQP